MSDNEQPKTQISTEYAPERLEELKENIEAVQKEIDDVWAQVQGQSESGTKPRLVAVSKLKPASDIQALYDAGYRHFGENYIQELVDKAEALPKDIKWHFIGALQSNKAKLAASIPNLYVLETLSSIKAANALNKSVPEGSTLNVYIQVNTSAEDAKSGVQPLTDKEDSDPNPAANDLIDLASHILTECPNLRMHGLMTIGSLSASTAEGEANPDFDTLKSTRKVLVSILKKKGVKNAPEKEDELELSMGMSADFKEAVTQGSSGVRVGTRIFGERPKKVKAGDGAGVTK